MSDDDSNSMGIDITTPRINTSACDLNNNLIPISYLNYNRRIIAFQGANHRKKETMKLPVDVTLYITDYMHFYHWRNLLDFFRLEMESDVLAVLSLREYVYRCLEIGSAILKYPFKNRRPNPFEVDSAGNIIKIDLTAWSLGESAFGNFTKLPPTLKRLELRTNSLRKLDTKALPRGLERLDVSNNLIEYLDFKSLPPRLTHLNIGDNPLYYDMDFRLLPAKLKRLYLAKIGLWNVDLQSFPEALEHVDLSDNPLGRLNLNITWTQSRKLRTICLGGMSHLDIILPSNIFICCSVSRLPWGTWIDCQQ